MGDHEQRRAGGQLVLQVADVGTCINVDRVPAHEREQGLACLLAARAASMGSLYYTQQGSHRCTASKSDWKSWVTRMHGLVAALSNGLAFPDTRHSSS